MGGFFFVLLQNFCVLSQNQFGQTLPVYFTACKIVVHIACTFTMERFKEFYFKIKNSSSNTVSFAYSLRHDFATF